MKMIFFDSKIYKNLIISVIIFYVLLLIFNIYYQTFSVYSLIIAPIVICSYYILRKRLPYIMIRENDLIILNCFFIKKKFELSKIHDIRIDYRYLYLDERKFSIVGISEENKKLLEEHIVRK